MKTSIKTLTGIFFILSLEVFGQSAFNYELSLVPVAVPNLPGLHSYAYAQDQGKWLILGGRKDGLHARQPFNAFPADQNNTDIYVVDIANAEVWSSSVNALPTPLKEQLQSTNMNFHQDEDTLYIIGGYGFSASANDHITYPYLTSINVPELISSIQNNQLIVPHFKQIQDINFSVTGGHLKKLKGLFYLVGGHRFNGRYNPMGNPTFTQTYTNQIRKFSIDNSANQLSFADYTAITDPVHLRRRDYNLLPQIFPDGEEGFTISSGVFQINADLPHLYPVDIKENSFNPVTTFNQYLSNYHSPVATFYDSIQNNMHSIFFGGISQYYYQNGTLIQDNQVPFVKTISRLTRDANGILSEYLLPIEMPALKGSSAEFIPNLNLSHYPNKVFKLNKITDNIFLVGHIFGGINSPTLNPFSSNQTNRTSADNTVYEVWLTVNPLSINPGEIGGENPFDISVFPNPFENEFNVKFNLKSTVKAIYFLTNSSGQILIKSETKFFNETDITINVKVENENSAELLLFTIIFDDKYYVTKKLMMK